MERKGSRGVVLLRHLRHVRPLPPDSIATVVNSLQNRVSITLCITLNAKTGKIGLVLVSLHSD